MLSKEYKPATPEQVELTEKVLQPTTDNIIVERGKVIARLHNEIAFGYTTIEAKQRVSNDEFLSLEPSIWKEFGEVLQELMQKMETKELGRKLFWNRSTRKRVKRG